MERYDVYYSDGNVRMFGSESIIELMKYLINEPIRGNENIVEIKSRDLSNKRED